MATISYSLRRFTPWVSLKLQLWLWITSNSSETGSGSRQLRRHFLHLNTIEYSGTCFLVFVVFSTSGRVVALITADISMAPLCQGIQGIQQTLQRTSRCRWGSSYQWFLNGTRQCPACTARKAGDGQNEICNFKLTPGWTLSWEEVLDNFNDCSNSGKSLSISSHSGVASSQRCPE